MSSEVAQAGAASLRAGLPSRTADPRGRYAEIDVLRGLAALCVVVSHYTSHAVRFFGGAPVHLDTIYGYYAVELFFVISGFVISLTLARTRTWREFAVSRVTRLYPVYCVSLTLMVVVERLAFGHPIWLGGYLANLTMLQEFLGFANLDNVYWSLTVELAFYAMVAAVFATGLWRRVELVAALWLATACLWSLLDEELGLPLPVALHRQLILAHVPFFVAGIAFYRIRAGGVSRTRVGLLLAALATVGWMEALPLSAGHASAPLGRMGIAAALFILFGLAVTGHLRFAVSRVTLWLGSISYALYLSHRNLGYSAMSGLHEAGVPVWITLVAVLAGALILATVLTDLVEQPAQRALRHWYRARAARREGDR
jgi:peptidoglycan/LPS O-acetylase OafA/YrhL